jgi:hypothetical protein
MRGSSSNSNLNTPCNEVMEPCVVGARELGRSLQLAAESLQKAAQHNGMRQNTEEVRSGGRQPTGKEEVARAAAGQDRVATKRREEARQGSASGACKQAAGRA